MSAKLRVMSAAWIAVWVAIGLFAGWAIWSGDDSHWIPCNYETELFDGERCVSRTDHSAHEGHDM